MIPHAAEAKVQQKIELLELRRYRKIADVDLGIFETMKHLRSPPRKVKYRPIDVGTKWGRDWSSAWFKGSIRLPAACKGQRVYYRMITGGELLLFLNGKPFSGFDRRHHEVLLTPQAHGNETWTVDLDGYAGHKWPTFHPFAPVLTPSQALRSTSDGPPLSLVASEILVEREETAGLFYDMTILSHIAKSLLLDSRRRAATIQGLYDASNLIPFEPKSEEEMEAASKKARALIAPLLKEKNGTSVPRIGVVGNSHLDVAWLWPLKETIRKAARTFTTQMQLMSDYSEMTFFQAQPKFIEMMEENYPQLLPHIQALAKRGRWEPNGGMYVEPDCNVIGGESLVRQLLVGAQITERVFGVRADTVCLPDTFGFSGSMPQILKKSGIKNFTTNKLRTNDTNKFPCSAFTWEGIDGSEVFGYLTQAPVGGLPYPDLLEGIWKAVTHKEVQDTILMPMGYGDGGGGVSREMVELLRRMKDTEGCIPSSFVNASEFLKTLREKTAHGPRYVGELYFEYHRGTYTTQAKTKKYNRRLEFLIRDAELLSSMAMRHGFKYPADELAEYWRIILTNQFHDILPGTSLKEVHDLMEAQSATIEKALLKMKTTAIDTLTQDLDSSQPGSAYAVVNTMSWARNDLLKLAVGSYDSAYDVSGTRLPAQTFNDGDKESLAIQVAVGPLSITPIFLKKSTTQPKSPFKHTTRTLETPHYKVRFDKSGKIVSLIDKAVNREAVKKGRKLNDLYIAEDLPPKNDAWDLYSFYRDTVVFENRLLSREIVDDGPLFTKIRSRYQIGEASTLTQDAVFYAHSRRIDFETSVDWQESHVILKSGFALDLNTHVCRNEIQFGHIMRDMHTNTSYDQAKFETYAHKWIDVSEGGYGVALLNDCKYGHDTLDGMVSITLLRSPTGPDLTTDKGIQEFTYSLLSHVGEFSVEQVVREGYELNVPLAATRLKKLKGISSSIEFCSVSNPNVVVETVKKAEKDDSIVLRVYEAGNSRGRVTITFSEPCVKAAECNLLEDEGAAIAVSDKSITFDILPFEIKSFKLSFRKGSSK